MYRSNSRITALFLCLMLLLPMLPLRVVAEGTRNADTGEVTVVSEVESKRTAFEKHYLLSNGNYCAVSYAEAIHEQNENGKWVNVDNTPVYSAKSATHSVKGKTYSADFDSKKGKTTLTDKDGKALSWHYELLGSAGQKERTSLSAEKATLQSTAALSPVGKAVGDQDTFALPRAQGTLRFEKAFGGMNADLSYTVSPQKIKEDVILYEKGAVSSLAMVVENCAYTAALSGAVVLFKDEDGKTAFKVDAPYMFDAAGADSTDVAVSLVQKGTTVIIAYTPSASWLNAADRVYPVTFDPAVTTNDYQAGIEDLHVTSGGTTSTTLNRLPVGKLSSNDSMAYFRIGTLPQTGTLPITAATFDLSFYAAASSAVNGKTLVLEQVTYSGTFSTLTYTTSVTPVHPIDSYTVAAGDTAHSFDMLTTGFLEASAENTPLTCRLRFSEELSSGNVAINSMESSSVSKPKPLLTVYYGYENPSFVGEQIFLNNNYTSNEDRQHMKMTGTTLSVVDYNVNEARASMALEEGDNGGVYIYANYEMRYLMVALSGENNYPAVNDTVMGSAMATQSNSASVQKAEFVFTPISRGEYVIQLLSNPRLVLTRTTNGLKLYNISSINAGQRWKITNIGDELKADGTVLENGIYYINNMNSRTFMVLNTSTATAPILTEGTKAALGDKMAWHIRNIGTGHFVIESVLRPGYYLTCSSSGVAVEFLSEYETVPNKAKFTTLKLDSKYLIKSGTNHYLAQSSSSPTVLGTSTNSSEERARWRLCLKAEYSEFSSSLTTPVIEIKPQSSASVPYETALSTRTWCTASDFTVTNGNTTAVSVSYNTVTGTAQGGISNVTIKHIPSGKSLTLTVKCGLFENGMYFFQNMDSNLFLQPDNAGENHMEQHNFAPTNQQWTLTLLSNGYYKILTSDNLALSVQSGKETIADKALVQRALSSSDLGQQWRITQTASGGYKVQAASAIENDVDLVMASGTSTELTELFEGTNVEQREYLDNTSYRYEWHIFNNKQLNTPVIAQDVSSEPNWCWAISAQMLARTQFPTTTDPHLLLDERQQAVYHVFGNDSATAQTYDWTNDPQKLLYKRGLPCDAARAAAYYAGMAGGDITYTSAYAPYSEEALIRFLNDGLPIEHMYARISADTSINNVSFDIRNMTKEKALEIADAITPDIGGHAVIIVGMRWDNSENCMKYTVIDPWGISPTQYVPTELTYEELIFLKKDTDGDSKIDEVSIWTSSVVKKTDYSDNLLFSDHLIADYNSLEEFGGAQ